MSVDGKIFFQFTHVQSIVHRYRGEGRRTLIKSLRYVLGSTGIEAGIENKRSEQFECYVIGDSKRSAETIRDWVFLAPMCNRVSFYGRLSSVGPAAPGAFFGALSARKTDGRGGGRVVEYVRVIVVIIRVGRYARNR